MNKVTTSAITDTKLYVPVVTLLTQDNAKLITQLKSDFKERLIQTNMNQKFQQKKCKIDI